MHDAAVLLYEEDQKDKIRNREGGSLFYVKGKKEKRKYFEKTVIEDDRVLNSDTKADLHISADGDVGADLCGGVDHRGLVDVTWLHNLWP
jgi:hypothetical protein